MPAPDAPRSFEAIKQVAVLADKGHCFEDFERGQVFRHHWGRTFQAAESTLFASLTLHYNPLYTNVEHARAQGHPDTPICPQLVFCTVQGLSVEDLSERGGAFLGLEDLEYRQPVYPGDTLTARSTVVDLRDSSSSPALGIATWHTEGFNQRGECVLSFRRTNMVPRRGSGA
jgi:itaconyl-CoA hydratase